MKIAAIEYCPTSTKGGSEKAFFEVLGGLKNLGHQITVFYVKQGDYLLEYQKLGINTIKLPKIQIAYFNVKSWLNLINASKVINATQPDAIYVNQIADSVTASVCKLFRDVKIVCHIRIPKQGNSKLFNLAGKFVDQFICVNHLIKEQYSGYFSPEKLMVISDGIKIPESAPLPQKNEFNYTATYLGRISPEKGLIKLLDAWLILKNKHKLEIRLDITGPADSVLETDFKQKLLDSVYQRKLDSLVNIKGPVTDPFDYLKHYDFSVFPSIIDESFGRTLPESVLAGVPVFARKVGIVEEILAPNKEDLVYRTEEELATKIAGFYQHPLNIDLVSLQEHIIKNYDINKSIYLLDKLFR